MTPISAAGLTRRHPDGDLPTAGFARVRAVRAGLGDEVLGTARRVIQRHALRGFDGIRLASALTHQHGRDDGVMIAGADQRSLRAATPERLATLNVETGGPTPGPHAS